MDSEDDASNNLNSWVWKSDDNKERVGNLGGRKGSLDANDRRNNAKA